MKQDLAAKGGLKDNRLYMWVFAQFPKESGEIRYLQWSAGSGVQGEDQRSAQCSHGHGKDVEVSPWAIIPFLPSCHHRTQKLTPPGSGVILVMKMGREDMF